MSVYYALAEHNPHVLTSWLHCDVPGKYSESGPAEGLLTLLSLYAYKRCMPCIRSRAH